MQHSCKRAKENDVKNEQLYKIWCADYIFCILGARKCRKQIGMQFLRVLNIFIQHRARFFVK